MAHEAREENETLDTDDLKVVVKAALKGHKISDSDLVNVLSALGLNKSGRVTTKVSKDSFVKDIRTLVDFYFSNYHKKEHADTVGELLYNGSIFSKDASNKASEKITRTMAS